MKVKSVVSVRDWKFYFEGDDFYRALLGDIARARHSIYVEMYILNDDEIGRAFLDAISERAREGVRVRLLVDGVGSLALSPAALERTRESGAEVRVYRPLRFPGIFGAGVWRRNHRKLIIIDQSVCYLGGMNIARELSLDVVGPKRWRDTMIRLRGEIAREARHMFQGLWKKSRKRFSRRPNAGFALTDMDDSGGFTLVENTTRARRKRHRRLYLRTLRSARESIVIEAAYFVPRYAILHILRSKARKGVRVDIIISRESDVPAARWAGRSVFAFLMKSGVRILEYPDRFLHAKCTLVDNKLAFLGSSNLDYQSLLRNHELDVIIRNPEAIRDLGRGVGADSRACVRIDPDAWRKRSRREKFLEKFFYLFRYFL